MTNRLCALAVAATLLLSGSATYAHPLATTTVLLVATQDGQLHLTIAADADALIAKLETLADTPVSAAAGSPISAARSTAAERRARLDTLSSALVDGIEARINESPLVWRLRDVLVDDTAQTEVHFTATMPAGSRTLTWRSTLASGSYPVAVRSLEGQEVITWLQGRQVSEPIRLDSARAPGGFVDTLVMGFTHIVPAGLDHILFVLGLFLLSRRPREVLLQVTAFTVAHSITLGLSLYGLVSVPPSIVEPMIALSVAYVGIENLVTSQLHPWRVAVVFAFGLLHGMGFAEALAGLHLSTSRFLTTLVSFNLGVEAGQLAVIATAATVLAVVTRVRATARVPTTRFASAAIGLAGAIWTIQRLTSG